MAYCKRFTDYLSTHDLKDLAWCAWYLKLTCCPLWYIQADMLGCGSSTIPGKPSEFTY